MSWVFCGATRLVDSVKTTVSTVVTNVTSWIGGGKRKRENIDDDVLPRYMEPVHQENVDYAPPSSKRRRFEHSPEPTESPFERPFTHYHHEKIKFSKPAVKRYVPTDDPFGPLQYQLPGSPTEPVSVRNRYDVHIFIFIRCCCSIRYPEHSAPQAGIMALEVVLSWQMMCEYDTTDTSFTAIQSPGGV